MSQMGASDVPKRAVTKRRTKLSDDSFEVHKTRLTLRNVEESTGMHGIAT